MSNTQEKLTAQVAAMYWGAELVQYIGNTEVKGIISQVSDISICIVFDGGKQSTWGIEYCKLILTPLSQISDEDAKEIARLLSGIGNEIIGVSFKNDELSFAIIDFPAVSFTIEEINADADCRDYLRSKSYDCDNLIARGLAIQKIN